MHQVYESVTAAASIYSAPCNQFKRALSDAPTTFKKIIRSTEEANLPSSVKRERLKKVNALIKEPDFRANELQDMIRSAIDLTQTYLKIFILIVTCLLPKNTP